ncbi:unnamed protein product [Schistosoma curassoni]|uniref:Uncharacterized protein n=1 Tax=Schistosoma curassoni TaxID=6186 RepID=A0A183JGA4_9TREM|nr:unnamed protein product [Schistosoma curassoni]
MEVSTEKHHKNLDEPSVIPIKTAPGSTSCQPPLLETSSDYAVRKFKVTAYLQRIPLTEHFNYVVSYLNDEAVRRATANRFAANDCFSVLVDTQQVAIQFLSRHQKASKNPIDYLNSLQQIAVQVLLRLDVMRREELVCSRFVEGLVPGPLREHFLRSPPIDTPDLKRTTLRFLAADKLANLSDAHPTSVMTVERATESGDLDRFQRTVAVTDFSSRVPAAGSQVRDGTDYQHGATTMGVKPNVYIARGLSGYQMMWLQLFP